MDIWKEHVAPSALLKFWYFQYGTRCLVNVVSGQWSIMHLKITLLVSRMSSHYKLLGKQEIGESFGIILLIPSWLSVDCTEGVV